MATSNVLCAHDGSFAAGLLESSARLVVDRVPTLLIAYDTDYPEPLHAVRPIGDAFGVALVLAPEASERALARIDVQLADAPPRRSRAELDALRAGNPAARVLLLDAIAAQRSTRVVLDTYRYARAGRRRDAGHVRGARVMTATIRSRRRSTMHGSPRTFRTAARCACSIRSMLGMPPASAAPRRATVIRTTRCARTDGLPPSAGSNTRRRRWPCTARCSVRTKRPRVGYLASVRNVDAFVDRLDTFAQPLVVEAERVSGDTRSVLYGFALRCGDRVLLSGRAAVMLDALAAGDANPR